MKGKKLRNIIVGVLLTLVGYIVNDAFMQPGPQGLKGNFKEIAFYRNENNTGPVIRVYAVTVEDTLWQEMKAYGDFMPHTKYGNTKVYFFLEGKPAPEKLYAGSENFDVAYKPFCIARYEKDAMSGVSFKKYSK
jgi:hypothetical protein